ncbi:MAG: FkbM family methyltransferase [Puniceicoccaceae bacterium]
MNSITRFIEYTQKFQNPVSAFSNRFRSPGMRCKITDRNTKIRLETRCGAVRMASEVWHDKDYDIPRFSLSPNDVVIDIGANHGAFSLYAATKGCQVYAFEPSDENFDLLQSNVETNRKQPQIRLFKKAVSDSSGTLKFYESDTMGGGKNSIIHRHAIHVQKTSEVDSITLPDFIRSKNIQHIRLIKMDCEGAEFGILKSLTPETLAIIDAMVIEFHWGCYDMPEFIKLLHQLEGFQIGFAEDKFCKRDIVRVVSERIQVALN